MTYEQLYEQLTKDKTGDALITIIGAESKDKGFISLFAWLDNNEPVGLEKSVYAAYEAFCRKDDLPILSKNKFTRYLRKLGVFLQFAKDNKNSTIKRYVQKTHCPTCHQLLP